MVEGSLHGCCIDCCLHSVVLCAMFSGCCVDSPECGEREEWWCTAGTLVAALVSVLVLLVLMAVMAAVGCSGSPICMCVCCQWLNDDQHGVARTPAHATVFANGVGLGAGKSCCRRSSSAASCCC